MILFIKCIIRKENLVRYEYKAMNYKECVICGCTPKPDEWSIVAENCCYDCA